VILNPAFNNEEIERERRQILSDIAREKDNLLRKTINIFLENLFLEHPYKFSVLGSEENVGGFQKDALEAFYNKVITPENMVISVVGDIESESALKIIKEKFGSIKRENFKDLVIKKEAPAHDIRKIIKQEKDKAQTHIILGFQAPSIYDEDKYAFEVMNTVLAGQGGRLFLELRDKKSLAYTVTSFQSPGIETGYFGVYIGTSPDKEKESLDGIKKELKLLLEKGITAEELDRAKNYIVGTYEIGLQKNSSQASQITFDELYGIGWEEYKTYPQDIMAVTKDDVLRVAKKYIDLDAYTLTIVKPE
ncbi:MAG: M16 family metallopeptidase, partial [Thermodesulfobacteriota bacterium]